MRDSQPPSGAQRQEILGSVDAYLGFVSEYFDSGCVDLDIEAHLAPEWTRVRPMLAKAVEAFQRSDLARMNRREAIRFVTGKDASEAGWTEEIDSIERVILAPNAHLGPYLGTYRTDTSLVILFGARLPEGSLAVAPDLSRTEILTRLDALSDDHRLHILRLAADEGELRATDVMTALDISQSAANIIVSTQRGFWTRHPPFSGFWGCRPTRFRAQQGEE